MKNNHNQSTDNYRLIPKIEPIPMAYWVTANCMAKEPTGKQDAHFSDVKFNLRKPPQEDETGFSKN